MSPLAVFFTDSVRAIPGRFMPNHETELEAAERRLEQASLRCRKLRGRGTVVSRLLESVGEDPQRRDAQDANRAARGLVGPTANAKVC